MGTLSFLKVTSWATATGKNVGLAVFNTPKVVSSVYENGFDAVAEVTSGNVNAGAAAGTNGICYKRN